MNPPSLAQLVLHRKFRCFANQSGMQAMCIGMSTAAVTKVQRPGFTMAKESGSAKVAATQTPYSAARCLSLLLSDADR